MSTPGWDSSVGIATPTPGESEFSAPVPEAHVATYTIGTGSFPVVKGQGRGLDRPPQSSAKVQQYLPRRVYGELNFLCLLHTLRY